MAEKSDSNRKELEKQTGVSGSKGAVAIAMGQALLTKGCTKDLLERLKVVYELAGFPGKAPGLDHGRGRQLLKKQDGGTSTEHKSASCSIPWGRRQGGVSQHPMEMCGCVQGCSIAPRARRGPGSAAGTSKGWGILGITQLCLPGAAFPVSPFAAAAWGCCSLACRGVQGLAGECRCPAQCFGWTPPSSLPCSHPRHPQCER